MKLKAKIETTITVAENDLKLCSANPMCQFLKEDYRNDFTMCKLFGCRLSRTKKGAVKQGGSGPKRCEQCLEKFKK